MDDPDFMPEKPKYNVPPAIPPQRRNALNGTLTPQQEAFCRAYMVDRNVTNAYRAAGYRGREQTKPWRVFNTEKVQARIAELTAAEAKKNTVTIESIRADLMRLAAESEDQGKLNVAVRCLELLGKHVGMFVEKSESSIRIINDDEAEINARIKRALQAANVPTSES